MALTTVTIEASAFASTSIQTDAPTLYERRWQVATDTTFAGDALITDTWYQDDYLDSYSFETPIGPTRYVRLQDRDNYGIISEWSDPLEVTVLPSLVIDNGGLYVATQNDLLGWSEWALHGSAEVISIDAADIPGRGPVLTLVVRRPDGVYVEHIHLSESEETPPEETVPTVDVGGLYVATQNDELGWSQWLTHESAEIIAMDAADIPSRGPVLTLVVRRPDGVFVEHILLTETET